MKKRILSILLCLCMVACMLPTVAFAADTGKAIQLVNTNNPTGGILGYKNNNSYDYIYMGSYNSSPVKWRVLDDQTNTGATGLFLLSEDLLGSGSYGGVYFDNTNPYSNAWQGSDAQSWCNSFYSNNLTTQEQGAVLTTTKSDEAFISSTYSVPFAASANILNGDRVFFLSAEEAEKSEYGFANDTARIANYGAYANVWWLRSPFAEFTSSVGTVDGFGRVYDCGVGVVWTARPAFNLNMNSVLFASAAVGGKPDGFKAVPEYTGNEWKLTIKDSSRKIYASAAKTNLKAGESLSVEYFGATNIGENEYISAMIADSAGNILYYGRVAHNNQNQSGTANVTVPSDLADGSYTLKLFSEQCNGDYKTDYAGEFRNISFTVKNKVNEQFTLTAGDRYYFDLSALGIPGTANDVLPDKTMHYVPFTYVGTVDAYALKDETDTDTTSYEHSLFIADCNAANATSWSELNEKEMIYGKTYTSGSIDYTLRAPSAGNASNGGYGGSGDPSNNEWDAILGKSTAYIKNWSLIASWGQDIWTKEGNGQYRSVRGYTSHYFCDKSNAADNYSYVGYRPVLELPTDLAADSLKVVELFTKGRMPGETFNRINIIVKKGESFPAPAAEGLPLSAGISADTPMWWVDENQNFYKPGDTVPADVSSLNAFYGSLGLFLDRGDGEVEVTPDNYTDIFGDGTASFVLPKGKNTTALGKSENLTFKDILEIYSTGKLERYGCVFPNLKLKNADLTSVRLSEEYIGYESPLFITADGKNTVGSLNGISMSRDTLSILGDGSLTLNSALTLEQYTQYGGGSVTMTDGLTAYYLSIDSGSLTVTGDPQAITLWNQDISDLYMGDGMRLFTGSSAQDAAEAAVPELSAEMQEVYQRYLAEDNTLTYEEISALNNALREQFNAIFRQLPGKTYVRITGAWNVTYQPGTNGSGNAVTDIKFYNDALTLKGKLFTRTGYTQVGWATVDGGEKVYGLDDIYTKNEALTLYPVWNANQYTITFDTNGGSEIAPITQDYGTAITAPANPTREGYTFMGWEREIPKTMPAENMTVTAQWEINRYTITFDTAGGSEIAPITQDYGTKITAPADPTRKGYTFKGWDKEIPKTMPAENMTVKAQWEINQYAITFDTNGGSEIAPITQDYGTNITSPADPTRKGYTFKGWDKEIPKTMPAENMTVKAQWEINQYAINFDTAGGSEIAPITQNYGSNITAPANPTREGYTFIGWDREIPKTVPAENITVTAQWEINRYTITFDTAGGSEIAPITQDYGSNITAPADPTRKGYTFKGWDKEIPKTMPAENITITARWRDTEKPTGEIIIGTNKWNKFLNELTFGIFFKDTQEVTINAVDNSGTVFVSYLVTDKELSEAELDSLVFRAYEEPFCIDPNGEYIVYVMLVDENINITYLRSDRLTLDNIHPVIGGIENGKTYCEAQTVTVDEKYVNTITVNGTEVTLDENNSFTLAPADGEQRIVVTDKAGNTAEKTVTVNDGHTFGEWTSNGDGTHTRQCTADGCTEGIETDNCTDEDKNHICDICGNIISNHEDANQDHVCDLCGKVISNHEDADKDHICDLCGKTISNHEDADNNHICDYCEKVISNHEDADKDHICDLCGKTISNHEDADKDHVCDYCGKVITNHIGGKETCRDKAVCEVCGKSYGKLDPKNHTDLKHFPAKAATEDADGNIEYWYCSGCNKYYSDKDGTKEIAKADTVTAKLPKSPLTGDTRNLVLWIALLFISGGVLTGVTVFDKRKRHSVK